jgi:hypothetical protein
LKQRAATTRSGARRATEAVIAGHDVTILERIRIDIPKKKRLARGLVRPLHSQLLIEIAVVHLAAPTDANRVTAHQPVNRRWIKGLDE